jgi:topoisomerase-4 subunit A
VLAQSGKLLLFPLAELKEMAKGKGLMLIDLAKNDETVGVAVSGKETLIIVGSSRGGKPVRQTLDVRAQAPFRGARARRGQEIPFKLKPTSLGLTGKQ